MKILFRKVFNYILQDNHEEEIIQKEFNFDFVPWVGLEICFPNHFDDEVGYMYYDVESAKFVVYLGDVDVGKKCSSRKHMLKFLTDGKWLEDGWELFER